MNRSRGFTIIEVTSVIALLTLVAVTACLLLLRYGFWSNMNKTNSKALANPSPTASSQLIYPSKCNASISESPDITNVNLYHTLVSPDGHWLLRFSRKDTYQQTEAIDLINQTSKNCLSLGRVYVVGGGARFNNAGTDIVFIDTSELTSAQDSLKIFSLTTDTFTLSKFPSQIASLANENSLAGLLNPIFSPDDTHIAFSIANAYEPSPDFGKILVFSALSGRSYLLKVTGLFSKWKDNDTVIYEVYDPTSIAEYQKDPDTEIRYLFKEVTINQ